MGFYRNVSFCCFNQYRLHNLWSSGQNENEIHMIENFKAVTAKNGGKPGPVWFHRPQVTRPRSQLFLTLTKKLKRPFTCLNFYSFIWQAVTEHALWAGPCTGCCGCCGCHRGQDRRPRLRVSRAWANGPSSPWLPALVQRNCKWLFWILLRLPFPAPVLLSALCTTAITFKEKSLLPSLVLL